MFAHIFKRFDPEQPRDQQGRWTDTGWGEEGGGKMMELFERLSAKDGGFTYQPVTGTEPTKGYALSTYPQRSWAKPASELKLTDLVSYVKQNSDLFERDNHFLGAWHDPETNKVFLDISVLTEDQKKAERLANKYDQIAYFDIGAGKSVTVNRNATSGGAAKGEEHGAETYDARSTWIESYLGGIGSSVQKTHRAGTDPGGVGGSASTTGFGAIFKTVGFSMTYIP